MLKWVVERGGTSNIRNTKGQLIATDLPTSQAEKIVAAHNAVIDAAFDSPGNVT